MPAVEHSACMPAVEYFVCMPTHDGPDFKIVEFLEFGKKVNALPVPMLRQVYAKTMNKQ